MAVHFGFAAYYRRRAAEERARARLAQAEHEATLHHELADHFEERALIVEASRRVLDT